MGYDISYHPCSTTDLEALYVNALANDAVAEQQIQKHQLSEGSKKQYLELLSRGQNLDTDKTFDTSHGYYMACALGLFGRYYYIRGTAFSFLLDNYPYYEKYLSNWSQLLPDFDFRQPVDNTIFTNYSSGVYLSPQGVVELLHDYHNDANTRLELDYFYNVDIVQFIAALEDAKGQNKGLLEATEVESPFEGNFSDRNNCVFPPETTDYTIDAHFDQEKKYNDALKAFFDAVDVDEALIAPLQALLKTHPNKGKVHYGLGRCYAILEDDEQAIQQLTLAQEQHFDTADLRIFLGEVYQNSGDLDTAHYWYTESLALVERELAWFRLGTVAEKNKEWEEAQRCYLEGLQRNSTVAEAHNNLGVYSAKLGDFSAATAYYRKAYLLKHNYYDTTKNLAWHLKKTGETEESKALALLALTKFKNKGEFYFLLGKLFRAERNNEQAIAYLQQGIHEHPDFPSCYSELSDIWMDQQHYAKAAQTLSTLREVAPNYAFGASQQGKLYKQQKQYKQAIIAYKEALDLGDTASNNQHQIGYCYDLLNEFDNAIPHYLEAIKTEKNDAKLYYNISYAYGAKKDYITAVDYLDKALALDPSYLGASYNKALYLYKAQDYAPSYDAFLAVAKTDPHYLATQAHLGHTSYFLNAYERAITYYTQHLQNKPEDYTANYYCGIAFQNIKNYEQALHHYRKAAAVKATNASLFYTMGTIAFFLKQDREAKQYLEKALALKPDDEEASQKLAEVNRALGGGNKGFFGNIFKK